VVAILAAFVDPILAARDIPVHHDVWSIIGPILVTSSANGIRSKVDRAVSIHDQFEAALNSIILLAPDH